MNLSGSIAEHQNSLQRMYRKLADRFEENSIIQALWRDMSEDVSLQAQGLKSLPASFWNQLRKNPDSRLEAAVKEYRPAVANTETISLRESFELALQSSEPIILKIYARIVRLLRGSPVTVQSLDFYILVKSHAARIVRTTESFAGDPILIRRAQLLLQGLEKEVQEPEPEVIKAAISAAKTQKPSVAAVKPSAGKVSGSAKKEPEKPVAASKSAKSAKSVESVKSAKSKEAPKPAQTAPKRPSQKAATPVKPSKARR
jgi:hypothetical protein